MSCQVHLKQSNCERVTGCTLLRGLREEGGSWGKMGKLAATPSLGLRRAAASTVRRGGPSRACVQHRRPDNISTSPLRLLLQV